MDEALHPSEPPKFLYFDLGNVLLNFDHALGCRQMAEVAGIEPEQVRRAIFETSLYRDYDTGAITSAQFFERFCELTESRAARAALFHAGAAIFRPNTSVWPLIVHLQRSGYRLGILSNTCEMHWQYVTDGRYSLLPRYFEVFALSYELGAAKPDAEIYRRAADLAGTAPQETFFVDDIAANVQGARAAGLDAVQFTTAATLVRDLAERRVRCNY